MSANHIWSSVWPALTGPLGWVLLLALGACFTACGGPPEPVEGVVAGPKVEQVKVSTASAPPVPMDFLWVLDPSTSMCQEQRELARAAPKMMARLASFDGGRMDPRSAMINIQHDLCLPSPPAMDDDGAKNIVVTRKVGDKIETLQPAPCAPGGSRMEYCIREVPHCGSEEAVVIGGGADCTTTADCARDSYCVHGQCGTYRGAVHVIGGRRPGETICYRARTTAPPRASSPAATSYCVVP